METYQEFMDRIGSFELPVPELGEGDFSVSPSVSVKVGADQQFLPYYGDTIVFDLADSEKQMLHGMINRLYEDAPACFCQRLGDSTLHMTLHDLSNAPKPEDVSAEMREHEARLRSLLAQEPVQPLSIPMRSKAVFNMVNTSIVLGLYTTDAAGYERLMALYQLADQLRTLPYPLTPHITLAYYRNGGFSHEDARKLTALVKELNRNTIEITLHTERLYYQHFRSMDAYENKLCFV